MKIFAATHEDSQQGWVWLYDRRLKKRSVVSITNLENKKRIYCEALQIENNFKNYYNQSPRIFIEEQKNALVLNNWYRSKLGDLTTQSEVDIYI